MSRQVSIRFGREDLAIIKRLEDEKGWDRSKAVRHVVRLIGTLLQQGKIDIEGTPIEVIDEIPDNCPICQADLGLRAPLQKYPPDQYDELYECEKNHVFRAVYTLVNLEELK